MSLQSSSLKRKWKRAADLDSEKWLINVEVIIWKAEKRHGKTKTPDKRGVVRFLK